MKTLKTEINWVMMPERPVRKSEPFKLQFGLLGSVQVLIFCEVYSGSYGIYDHLMREAVYDFEREEFIDENGAVGYEVYNDVVAWAYYEEIFEGIKDAYLATIQ